MTGDTVSHVAPPSVEATSVLASVEFAMAQPVCSSTKSGWPYHSTSAMGVHVAPPSVVRASSNGGVLKPKVSGSDQPICGLRKLSPREGAGLAVQLSPPSVVV